MAWVTGKAKLEVYDSVPVVNAVNALITETEKKDVKIQLFGDSITDNQWGDNTTWANYIQQMMPDYTVTVVNGTIKRSIMKTLKMIFCRHEYEYIRTLYGDEINAHNGKRKEYRCVKCGMYKWR